MSLREDMWIMDNMDNVDNADNVDNVDNGHSSETMLISCHS